MINSNPFSVSNIFLFSFAYNSKYYNRNEIFLYTIILLYIHLLFLTFSLLPLLTPTYPFHSLSSLSVASTTHTKKFFGRGVKSKCKEKLELRGINCMYYMSHIKYLITRYSLTDKPWGNARSPLLLKKF